MHELLSDELHVFENTERETGSFTVAVFSYDLTFSGCKLCNNEITKRLVHG